MSDSHKRSITKALIYRVIAFIADTLIAWCITGNIGLAFKFGIVVFIIHTVMYYMYERVWQKIKWGIVTDQEEELPT
jgi:uncharacterized membrane protein